MNKSKIGAQSIMANLRKRVGNTGEMNEGSSLSSMMSNATLESFIKPHDGITLACFKVASTDHTVESVTGKINDIFKGELQVVPGSIRYLESTDYFTSVSAHLVRNIITKPLLEGKTPNGFISLSRNLFMEERDSTTWKLITAEDGNKILVRDNSVETDEDMEKLMSSLSSSSHQFSAEAKKLTALAHNVANMELGVLVSYTSESGDIGIGFIAEPMDDQARIGLVSKSSGEIGYRSVPATAIIQGFDLKDYFSQLNLPQVEMVAAAGLSVDAKIEYYKKVYGYNEAFLNMWLDRVRRGNTPVK